MSDWDDHFSDQERRESRGARKRASATDRSKYKRSDLDKLPKEELKEGEQGRVVMISGLGIEVMAAGERLHCVLRGSLKKEATRMRRLVVVGDLVRFERLGAGEGVIVAVEPRRTLLTRTDPIHHRRQHLIAANIDQVLITASVVSPPMKPGLIDRYILATERGEMEPVLLINKVDLLPPEGEERLLFEELTSVYRKLSYTVIPISTVTGEGVDLLLSKMEGRSSLFSGQSGTGKSSLINATLGLHLPTGEVVSRTRKGSHTTTRARLIPVGKEGWCIDSPGVQSFGVWELQPDEVEGYFHEIAELGAQCYYPNCTHSCEPKCAVREAVEAGLLSQVRYDSYLALCESARLPPRRR